MGYHRAGFTEIVGVDLAPHPNYPFKFVQGDALEFLAVHGGEFDAIHASPPCQLFTVMAAKDGRHVDLLTPTLAALQGIEALWVVENVMTAPMPVTVVLCGSSFGLRVRRHRKFASNVLIPGLPCRHKEQGTPIGVYGWGDGKRRGRIEQGTYAGKRNFGLQYFSRAEASAAMGGLDWMTIREICEAIPPAYTEHIGHNLLATLRLSESD